MTKKQRQIIPERGDIYLVNFDPTIGAEIKKTHPALILQNDISNRHSPVTIVAAITTQFKEPTYPVEVLIHKQDGGLKSNSVILLNQIRSIDKRRLIKRLGTLNNETMKKVGQAIEISLGLIDI